MADYIKREDAIMTAMDYDGCGNAQDASQDIAAALASIQAADVRENVRGEWIDTTNYFMRWQCSVCGNHTRDARPPYCPYCGAEMRGVKNG